MPLSMLQETSHDVPCKTRGQDGFATSFPVGLLHPLQHAGLSRRSPSSRPPGTHQEVRLSKRRRAKMAIDWREIASKVGGFDPGGEERIVGTDGARRALGAVIKL